MNSNHIGWHNIDGNNPTSIATGDLSVSSKINWVFAVPTKYGLNRLSNGEDVTELYEVSTVIANGVSYYVFRQIEQSKRANIIFVSNGSTPSTPEPTDPTTPHYYWYAGVGPVNEATVPGEDNNWHLIDGIPTNIVTGEQSSDTKINWIVAVPTALNLNHISNGEDITDMYNVANIVTSDGIEYKVFTQAESTKKLDITIIQ
jgi:hypothetical protein